MTLTLRSLAGPLLVIAMTSAPSAQQPAGEPLLKATIHPRFSEDPSKLWMAPTSARRTTSEFAAAVKLEVDGNFAKALPILSQPSLQQGTLGDYALYYQGFAEMRVGRLSDARRTFQALQAKPPIGYLVEGAALREAECDEALGDQPAALDVYERLSKSKTTAPDEVLMRLGRAARAVGNTEKAVDAFMRVLYEFPFGDLAQIAGTELDTLPARAQAEEARLPKLLLEKRLGVPVNSFAYPFGLYDREVREAVEAAGYTAACTMNSWADTSGDHPLEVPRIAVFDDTDAESLAARLSASRGPARRAALRARRVAQLRARRRRTRPGGMIPAPGARLDRRRA